MHGATESKKIGEILINLKVLSHFDLDRVLEAQQKRQRKVKFGQLARAMGLITEEHILAAMAVQMQLLPGIERMSLAQILQHLQSASSTA
jgi:hypothetical protein